MRLEQGGDRPRKFLRITTTMFLDWPQFGFELHAPESQKTNDFEGPEDVPEEVMRKLKGFIRSGHVRFLIITQRRDQTQHVEDVTPTEEVIAEDDEDEDDWTEETPAESSVPPAAPPAEGEPPQSTPAATTPAATTPATNPDPAAPPAEGEPPQS